MKEEILSKLKQKLAALSSVDEASITGETNLKTDLKVSSLEMSKLLSEFEEEYDAFIKYTEMMHVETVDQAADVIARSVE